MWHYEIWNHSPLTSVGVVHSTWPSRAMWHVHAPTFNKKKKKKKTLHMLTHDAMRWCELTSLMICIIDEICDIRERNVTIRSEVWITNLCSLRFRDIMGLILGSLGCTSHPSNIKKETEKLAWDLWFTHKLIHFRITWFRSIRVLCGTDNIPLYVPRHSHFQ